MIMYDAQLQEVTLENGEVKRIPPWVGKAANNCDDPSDMIRFWLKAQNVIDKDQEVMVLDLADLDMTPVEAPAPV